MLEESLKLNEKTAIFEEDVSKLLQKLKDTREKRSEIALVLLKNQNVVRYFKYNIQHYCKLHAQIITETEDFETLMNFLKSEHTFQKVITERDDFYLHFFDVLLVPLIKVTSKFSKNNEVFQGVSSIIQKCIFSRNYKIFESALSGQKQSLPKKLFKNLSHLYSQDYASLGFRLIFYSFSHSYNDFGLIYRIFIILVEMVGFNIKDQFAMNVFKYEASDPSLCKSFIILNELIDVIAEIKFDLEYKINEITFTDFIKALLKSVISLTKVPNYYCYKILLKVVEINPLIIESTIDEIIVYIMLADNSKCKQEYEEIMIKIFEVFSKLHRIQNLISKMIPTLKSGIENFQVNEAIFTFRGNLDREQRGTEHDVQNIFPTTVLDYFTNCIINLASWQVINLFKTLLYHLNVAVDELNEIKEESSKLIYMEILCTLTCWMLSSVRMAEHTISSVTVGKFVGGLEELRTILGKFGVNLLHREHNHILMRTFLNVCYYWAEIYITLEYYSINDEVKIKKNMDNNSSSSNLTYLHSYLSSKEWCLISERITNFGGKPCKEIMQKLIIQKLRTLLIFENNINEDVINSIVRSLASDFDTNSIEIFTDKFVVNNILGKMPTSIIINISETIVKDLFEDNNKIMRQSHIWDSHLIINGILCVVFAKINKLLKQKRKLDEKGVKKTFCSRIMTLLPSDIFLSSTNEYLSKTIEILNSEEEALNVDLKLNESKIQKYIEILQKLPIIFNSEFNQKLVVLLLVALHRDFRESNCVGNSKKKCESLIISIVQHSKFNLLDLFDGDILMKMISTFDRAEDLFYHIANNVFKDDGAILNFQTAIMHIKDNIKESVISLKFAVIVLNLLNKIKRNKMSSDNKELCVNYKMVICNKIVKIISKSEPESHLIEPYAFVLKTFLAKDENDSLSKLQIRLNDYVEFCLSNLSDDNIKGSLLLFTAILHNKSAVLLNFDNDLILRIWNNLKKISIKSDIMDEYSQLLMLITSLIPNEQFSNIFEDLLIVTEKSIDSSDNDEFSKHLKTWMCILSTNFNPVKTNILREQLKLLLEKLIVMLKFVEYQEDLFNEIIQFEVAIIQINHVPLTSTVVDIFLLTVTTLMMKNTHNFVHVFNLSISIMESLVKYRNPLIMDRLPPYLLQYRILLIELRVRGNSNLALEQSEVQKIADCAHQLEKLTKILVECTKDMARISMYLIADILGQYEVDTLYPNVKKHLDNCIYSLISLCDHHAVQYLMRVLSNASTEIFKIMYENYKKYYRFTGKV